MSNLTIILGSIWLVLLLAHMIINYIIYINIGKEEFEVEPIWGNHSYTDEILSLFTFHWSASYQEHESAETRLLLRISNILGPVFAGYTATCVLGWMFTYGK